MKILFQLLNLTGEQIVLTSFIVFILYCIITGVVSLIASPPSLFIISIILGWGCLLGLLKCLALNVFEEENTPKR